MQLHSLETQFALLDDLPDSLYLPVVTHTHGELLPRIAGILQWRAALLAGQLPEETALVWPENTIKRTVLMRLEALDMVQYCQEQIALTDSVLESILEAVTSAEDQANKHGEAGIFNDELAQRQKQRDRDSVFEDKDTLQSPQTTTETQPRSQNKASGDQNASAAEQSAQYDNQQELEQTTESAPSEQVLEQAAEPMSSDPVIQTQYDNKQKLQPAIEPLASFEQDIQFDDNQGSKQTTKPYNNNTLQQEQSESAIEQADNLPPLPSEHANNDSTKKLEHAPYAVSKEDSNNENTVSKTANHNTDALSNNPSEALEDSNNRTAIQPFAIADYAAQHLEQEWQDLAHTWHELAEHYDDLAQHLGLGWDLSQGVLASDGWRNIIQHRKRIKHSPYLQQLVAALGRLREYNVHKEAIHKEMESFSNTVMTGLKRQQEEVKDIITPYAINDTGGIKRGDDIARMLPSELSLLGHPQLNLLWHVKRAERTLLSYQLQGVSKQIELSEQEVIEEHSDKNQSPEQGHGPIIICLDTSASMQGEPEQIAKALVLEALRIATDEARACYVYSFGGQQQILEHELDLSKGGLSQLLNFLQHSFTGGTDVSYALRKALHKQSEVAWKNADILLISDGRFPVDQRLEQKISTLKKHSDLRIHGVLLGQWRGQAIQNICEPLHRFTDIMLEA